MEIEMLIDKIPGTAQEANRNTLRASWFERLVVWWFGEKLVSEDADVRVIARRYRGRIYMVKTILKGEAPCG
jgi:hypothetical protein